MALAAVPLPTLLGQIDDASDAQATRDALVVRQRVIAPTGEAQPEAPAGVGFGVLRTERAGQALIAAAIQHAYGLSLVGVTQAWPKPHCLAINSGGQQLFAVNEHQLLIPASTQKLLTAAGILAHLDLNERLVTRVLASSAPFGGTFNGTLWIVGGADPLIATRAYVNSHRRQPQLYTPIEDLVQQLIDLPIQTLTGRLVADETRHDSVRYVPSWPLRYQAQRNAGPLSALIVNDALTASLDYSPEEPLDPAREFAKLTADLLIARGVEVDVVIGSGRAPEGAIEIARIESPTVAQMLQQMLRESDNNTAEILLREVGFRASGQGTSAAGAAAVLEAVGEILSQVAAEDLGDAESAGEPPVVNDGSGLDLGNATSCVQLIFLLSHYGPDSLVGQGLPVAARSGTLAHRFRGHPASGKLAAKTGLLTNVNALAGFLETNTGLLTFAQIINGVPARTRIGLNAQEELMTLLVEGPIDCDLAETVLRPPWDISAVGDEQIQALLGQSPGCVWVAPAPEPEPGQETPLSEEGKVEQGEAEQGETEQTAGDPNQPQQ